PRRRLSVRSRRRGGLDRAALLYRRRDAEPPSDPAIRRSVRGRKGMALEWHALPAHRGRLASQFRCASRRDRGSASSRLRRRYWLVDAALALVLPRDLRIVR